MPASLSGDGRYVRCVTPAHNASVGAAAIEERVYLTLNGQQVTLTLALSLTLTLALTLTLILTLALTLTLTLTLTVPRGGAHFRLHAAAAARCSLPSERPLCWWHPP